eukprot:TRINITY_DN104362_c0_g1_i1.p1 TRINITY_DN104362_c0_g1~~TRINITY_DN104362_c0_g1_i1.p1  ORF type:complete len:482 (-),score=47.56 TRINITY_DN104362_c0_g1_i1:39-1484(-)
MSLDVRRPLPKKQCGATKPWETSTKQRGLMNRQVWNESPASTTLTPGLQGVGHVPSGSPSHWNSYYPGVRQEYTYSPPPSNMYSASRGYQACQGPPIPSPVLSTAPTPPRTVHWTPQRQTTWEPESQAMMHHPWLPAKKQLSSPPPAPSSPPDLMNLNPWGGHESFPPPSADWLRGGRSSEERQPIQTPWECPSQSSRERSAFGAENVSDRDQSSGLHIRNTFFESSSQDRSASLEPFVRERRSQSQPSSPPQTARPDLHCTDEQEDTVYPELGSGIFETPSASISEEMLGRSLRVQLPLFGQGQECGMMQQSSRLGRGDQSSANRSSMVDLVAEFNAGVNRPELELSGRQLAETSVMRVPGSPTEGGWTTSTSASNSNSNAGSGEVSGSRRQSCDSDGLEKPTLGSAQLPSRGSALHRWGACKPCAFVFNGGCTNAVECEFCHLCGPGEKRRRRKERQCQKRELAPEGPPRNNYPQQWNS